MNTFFVNQAVKVVDSGFSHVLVGMWGVVTSVEKEGCAVWFPETVHIGLFGGAGYTKEAIVFMPLNHIE